ncbi:abasic site processing protein HMCES isoform X2 [Microcebus murinus]|uniref:abasic site processing protein HMCES isoform X2 n=1 Tax=Microcebus murinus TaxID=30608 RepID=UPI003F6B56F7
MTSSLKPPPPGHRPPVQKCRTGGEEADPSERVIAPMRWGLVPSWFKERDPRSLQFNTTNCRSDTILEKRSFKVPLGKGRRCVVLADGFYEWRRCPGSGQRQPYFIYFPQAQTEQSGGGGGPQHGLGDREVVWENWRPLTMAGVFDCWEPPEGGDALYSFSIITVDSCHALSDIHHRMPAILDGEAAVSQWLDFGGVPTQEAMRLIRPTENVAFHPVSTVVNNSRNDTPECLAPVDLAVKKEPTAGGGALLRWLATKSPGTEDPASPRRGRPDVPQGSSQFLRGGPSPPRRGGAGLLRRWLKRETEAEDEPAAKRAGP